MHVLDTSAFIHARRPDGEVATVPGVREELTGGDAYRFEAWEGAGMRLHVPEADAEDRVRRAAAATGDRGELSATDRRLLAAALELDATLVTDDYAMQNVADHLDLPVEAIEREGIEERRDWLFQCRGCGRTFEDEHDRCPVCGSGLTRKNPSDSDPD